jgi:multiple sugar transport system permease protein
MTSLDMTHRPVRRRRPFGERLREAIPDILTYLGILALIAIFVMPIAWIVGISFKTRPQIFTSPPLFLWEPTLENYATVLRTSAFLPALWNSLVTSIGAVLLSLIAGVPAAYTIARIPFTGRTFIYYALLIMRMLPPIAVLVPMFMLFDWVGMTNSRTSVALAYTTFCLPLVVWVMRGFFEQLPVELEESAAIDGASRFRTFFSIVLPLARPGLVAISILCLLTAWNDFLFAAVLTNTATQTLPVLLAGYSTADSGVDWGALAASGILVVTPVIIIAFAVQRHLIAGLSAGAMKG